MLATSPWMSLALKFTFYADDPAVLAACFRPLVTARLMSEGLEEGVTFPEFLFVEVFG